MDITTANFWSTRAMRLLLHRLQNMLFQFPIAVGIRRRDFSLGPYDFVFCTEKIRIRLYAVHSDRYLKVVVGTPLF